eukprot:1324906-Alexandrium_andersonii.AAC.1
MDTFGSERLARLIEQTVLVDGVPTVQRAMHAQLNAARAWSAHQSPPPPGRARAYARAQAIVPTTDASWAWLALQVTGHHVRLLEVAQAVSLVRPPRQAPLGRGA